MKDKRRQLKRELIEPISIVRELLKSPVIEIARPWQSVGILVILHRASRFVIVSTVKRADPIPELSEQHLSHHNESSSFSGIRA
jgi:hypothetical protein